MGNRINKSNVYGQLAATNSELQDSVTSSYQAQTAIRSYVDNRNLSGDGHGNIKAHFERHQIIMNGMLGVADELLVANRSYETQIGSWLTELNVYDEEKLNNQLNTVNNLIAQAEADPIYLSPLSNGLYMTANRIRRQLNQLSNFVGSTGGLYTSASSYIATLQACIHAMDSIYYDASTRSFVVPIGTDMRPFDSLCILNQQKEAEGYQCIEVGTDGAFIKGLKDCCLFSVDPVNLSTGNLIYQKEDLFVPGLSGLRFHRFYNALEREGGSLSRGWNHNYEVYLELGVDRLILHLDDGHEEAFLKMEEGFYQNGSTGVGGILVKEVEESTSGESLLLYQYTNQENQTHSFNHLGQEIRRETERGTAITFTYNEAGQLTCAQGLEEECLTYDYDEGGNLIEVKDHTGRTVKLGYKKKVLRSVTTSDGETIQYHYDYEGLLDRVTNQRGIKTLRNSYDAKNRIINQRFPDGGIMEYVYHDKDHQVTLIEQNKNQITYQYDNKRQTTDVIHSDGTEHYTYDDHYHRTSYENKLGHMTKYGYNKNGDMTSVTDPLGHTLRLTYDQNHHLITIAQNEEEKFTYSYDKRGNLTHTLDALQRSQSFVYNEMGQPTTVTLADESQLHLSYDKKGNLIAIQNPQGNTQYYEYDALNRVCKTIDSKEQETTYRYDTQNRITQVTNAQGQTRTYTYNESGKVTSVTDFNGSITTQEYGVLNKPSKVIHPVGGETTYEYDLMWNLTKETNPLGGETTYEYDPWNRITSVTANEGTIQYEYDAVGNRTKIVNQEGAETRFSYDANGNLIKVIEPTGGEIQYIYNPEGKVESITNPKGQRQTYEYDKAGQLIKETNFAGIETRYSYDVLGNVMEKIVGTQKSEAATALTTTYEYQKGGLLEAVTYPDGRKETYTYDRNQNLETKTNGAGECITYVYDSLNRITTIQNNFGQQKSYEYDAVGNVTALIDGKGNRTEYCYDLAGNLIEVKDPLGNIASYTYDLLGNLIEINQQEKTETKQVETLGIDQDLKEAQNHNQENNQRNTKYQRNAFGQLEAIIDGQGKKETFQYDLIGNLIQKIDKEGYETTYSYNRIGQVVGIQYADGKEVRYSYDALHQLEQVEDWLGITRMELDDAGRVTKVETPKKETISYEWGSYGERKGITYPSGKEVRYHYDHALRLTKVIDGTQEVNYSYDNHSRLVEKAFISGQQTRYSYNETGLLSSLSHYNGTNRTDHYEYAYDLLGNKTTIQKERQGIPEDSGSFTYSYDPLNRLQEVGKDGKPLRTYHYDGYGNRTAMVEKGVTTSYTYNNVNQLIHKKDQRHEEPTKEGLLIEETYQYDQRGNLTHTYQNGTLINQYHFGAMNRLEKAMNYTTGMAATYRYNGLGHRVEKTEGAPTEIPSETIGIERAVGINTEPVLPMKKLEGMNLNPTRKIEDVIDYTKQYHNLLERTENDNPIAFTWDSNILSATNKNETYNYLKDDLGSPIRLIDQNKEELEVYGYDEFGQETINSQKHLKNHRFQDDQNQRLQASLQPFGYTGYQRDSITNTYFAQAREYQPEIGRFTGEDIIKGNGAYPFTLNQYGYCWNSPMGLVDLDGRMPDGMTHDDIVLYYEHPELWIGSEGESGYYDDTFYGDVKGPSFVGKPAKASAGTNTQSNGGYEEGKGFEYGAYGASASGGMGKIGYADREGAWQAIYEMEVVNAGASVGITNEFIGARAYANTVSFSGKTRFIEVAGYRIYIGGNVDVFSAGAKLGYNVKEKKFDIGLSLGVGVGLSISWENVDDIVEECN